nr:hypothetical protein [uncultured Bacteroides sp.]
MKIFKYISLVLVMIAAISCDKNEVEYNTTAISSDVAEFQLHYFVPVTATSANNIYQIKINDQLYANSTAPLSTYNAVPYGSVVGRFYSVDPGEVNVKLYKGTGLELVYDQNVTLSKGKQNVFVYDFNKVPTVFDNEYPYSANTTENTDSTAYVKFYNFLYETEGVPCSLKLQYQYVDPRTKEVLNLGNPVSFGETTGWQAIKIVKSVYNSSGYCRIDYKIKVVDANGVIGNDLQLWNSNGKYVSYTGYQNEYIGRRYHHTIGGMRSAKPAASVRQFTAL